jgi:hypothetical protein
MFSEFFTLEMLVTFTGAVLAVGVITEMFKKIGIFLSCPTQLVSYIVALIVLIGGNLALGTFTWSGLFLMVLNAAVIALASNGGYDLVDKVASIGERNAAEAEVEAMLELEAEANSPDVDNG